MVVRLEYYFRLCHGTEQGDRLGQQCSLSGLERYIVVFANPIERNQPFRPQLERRKTIEPPPCGIADIRKQRFSCLHRIVAVLRPVGKHDHL